jgi:molybdopterin-containing oxidoreductase family membrane subunit
MLFCNVAVTQLLWSAKIRRSPAWLFVISLLINLGMWLERFVIVITSLQRGHMASEWRLFHPTFWDYATLAGSLGFFATCYLLFARVAPILALSELREKPGLPAKEWR